MKIKEFFLKIVRKIFFIQDEISKEKKPKKISVLNYSKHPMTKSKITSGASLTFSLELEKNKNTIKDEVTRLAKNNTDNPAKLLDYAKEKGAKSYFIKKAGVLLNIIKEKEGFILPKKGLRALYLNLLTSKKPLFKTPCMFVFEDKGLDIYTILYNFYKWYSYTKGLPGFTEEYAEKIQNLDEFEKMNFDKLTYDEMVGLKQAIERDKEALEFATTFARALEGAKKAYDIMKNSDKGASL